MATCRFTLLIEFNDDDELIAAIAAIEKELPTYDYASRPLSFATLGKKGGFKFLAFKDLSSVAEFPKFAAKVFKLQLKIPAVRINPGYVSLTNAVSATPHTVTGGIFGEKQFYYKLQLVFTEKHLVAYALSDELYKDRRSVSYLNDVWQLVRGAR